MEGELLGARTGQRVSQTDPQQVCEVGYMHVFFSKSGTDPEMGQAKV